MAVVMFMPRARNKSSATLLCRNNGDAEELVFTTLAQAVRKIRQYSPSGDFFSWLYTILLNFHRMEGRKKRPNVVPVGLPQDLSQVSAGGSNDADAKMQEQMKSGGMALHPEGHTPPPGGLDRRSLGGGGCPGKAMRQFNRVAAPLPTRQDNSQLTTPNSQLSQWPCQIRLVPVKAPFFQGAKLLIAADCTAYAYANFHQEFMRGKVTIVGCPKLDPVDYSEKLTHGGSMLRRA